MNSQYRLAKLAQTRRFLEAVQMLTITVETCEDFAKHHDRTQGNEHHAEHWRAEAEQAVEEVCDLFEYSMNELDAMPWSEAS